VKESSIQQYGYMCTHHHICSHQLGHPICAQWRSLQRAAKGPTERHLYAPLGILKCTDDNAGRSLPLPMDNAH
jgi:hypothetical protein